ncbi:Multidrug resistance-associated protein 4 [Nymphon striatum]|nr:Multidrug resistance-associated protein 4 [Nymphon striatum]KAG1652394.1 Multidrug resistance-associated protein 4 [Nymphon striatum]KAG1652395.1 Multidrug resistance-associated protein 4 [Nymphon striatum]KAG1652399.1 Multidrug resistance-associated protein 4 [Nymphon striatum]KAG1652400.1 Multidrug resistance-associated protein 4 [Nymphon striatum]
MLITCVKSNDTTNTVEDLKFTEILQTDLNCYIAPPPGFLVPNWTYPILRKGWNQKLELDDYREIPEYLQTKNLDRKFSKLYATKKPSIWTLAWTLFKIAQDDITTSWIFCIIMEIVQKPLQPLLFYLLLVELQKEEDYDHNMALIYAFSTCGLVLLQPLCYHQQIYHIQIAGMSIRSTLCSAVYRKITRISPQGFIKTNTGEIMNIMTNDINRFDSEFQHLNFVVSTPLQCIVVCAILWYNVGALPVIGMFGLLIMVPVQIIFGKKIYKLRFKLVQIEFLYSEINVWKNFLSIEEYSTGNVNEIINVMKHKLHIELFPSVSFNKVYSSYGMNKENILNGISFKLKSGDLLCVIGEVGSGKTSLLKTVLKELVINLGSVKVRGKIAYASQQSWIFSDTIKNNIIFGSKFNDKRYMDVIDACCLSKDINDMPNADETVVGERGIRLSGGQRARVSLARKALKSPVVKHGLHIIFGHYARNCLHLRHLSTLDPSFTRDYCVARTAYHKGIRYAKAAYLHKKSEMLIINAKELGIKALHRDIKIRTPSSSISIHSLFDHCKDLFISDNPLPSEFTQIPSCERENHPLLYPYSLQEIKAVLLRVKSKACSLSGYLSPLSLKLLLPGIAPILHTLFNHFLSNSDFPSC